MVVQRKPKANLTDAERQQVISHLNERGTMVNGQFKLKPSAQKDTAIFFNISQSTVNKIWRRAVANRLDPDINAYVAPSVIKYNSGRLQLYDRDELLEQLSKLSPSKRRTMRSIAGQLGISLATVWRLCNVENIIIPHSNAAYTTTTAAPAETATTPAATTTETIPAPAAAIEAPAAEPSQETTTVAPAPVAETTPAAAVATTTTESVTQ